MPLLFFYNKKRVTLRTWNVKQKEPRRFSTVIVEERRGSFASNKVRVDTYFNDTLQERTRHVLEVFIL